jgi:hypothetical protein
MINFRVGILANVAVSFNGCAVVVRFRTRRELTVIRIVFAVTLVVIPAQNHVSRRRPVTVFVETMAAAAAAMTAASLAASLAAALVSA